MGGVARRRPCITPGARLTSTPRKGVGVVDTVPSMGTPVYVTLLVAAIAGVVALSVGWFARITARDIAALTANQKRQDVRIKALGAYVDLLMSAAAATQAYVWYADPEFVRN